jgi:hypothetical protein
MRRIETDAVSAAVAAGSFRPGAGFPPSGYKMASDMARSPFARKPSAPARAGITASASVSLYRKTARAFDRLPVGIS